MKTTANFYQQEKGIAQLVVVLVLFIALGTGVLLIQQRTSFWSQADDQSSLQIVGSKIVNGVSSSHLVKLKINYGGKSTPQLIRVANDLGTLNQGAVFNYTQDTIDQGILWNLGSNTGLHNVWVQFYVDGQWQNPPITQSISLTTASNPANIQVTCDINNSPPVAEIRWINPASSNQSNIALFRQRGDVLYIGLTDKNPARISIPSASLKYTLLVANLNVGTDQNDMNILQSSEISFSCSDTIQTATPPTQSLDYSCNDTECIFNWGVGQIRADKYEVIVQSRSLDNNLITSFVGTTNQNTLTVPITTLKYGTVTSDPFNNFQVRALKASTNPVASFNSPDYASTKSYLK